MAVAAELVGSPPYSWGGCYLAPVEPSISECIFYVAKPQ